MIDYRRNKKKKGIQFGNGGGKRGKEIVYSSEEQNMERDSLEELNAVTSTYAQAAKAEFLQFKQNTDANYFTVLTFNNVDQRNEFLEKIGLKLKDRQYADGRELAKALGIELTTPDRKAPGSFRASKALKDLVR